VSKQTSALRPRLLEGLEYLSVPGGAALADGLLHYLEELIRWNKTYNLTAVRDPAEMVTRHLLDSLSVDTFIKSDSVLDVGAGAGLPGIPLALVNPHASFVLMDSNGKKIRFIEHVVRELKLQNVLPLQARVESHPDQVVFDTIVCRAYASLLDFVSSSGHLLADGGEMIAMKGKVPQAELDELPATWTVARMDKVDVPGLDGERHILVLRQTLSVKHPNGL
jgi:16S rRNA (guanine527-N7)-methyltransferase